MRGHRPQRVSHPLRIVIIRRSYPELRNFVHISEDNPVEPLRRVRLNTLMAGMAANDDAMTAALMVEFRPELERAARFHATSLGHRSLTSGDVSSMVAEFAMTIADAAAGWRPDGALPWTWAKARLRQVAIDMLVQPAIDLGFEGDDLADEGSQAFGVDNDGEFFGTLVELAHTRLELRPVVIALAGATPHHREIALSYRMQQRQGDPSPSHSVAAWHNTTPANVRQIARRVWRRLDGVDLDDMMVS